MILFIAGAIMSFCIAMYISQYRLVSTIFESKWSFAIWYPCAIGVSVYIIVLTFVVANLSPNEFAFSFVSNLYSSLGAEIFLGIFAGLFGQQWLRASERRNQHDPKTDEYKVAARTARNQSVVVAVLVLSALLVQDSARIFELLKGVQTPVLSVEFNQPANELSQNTTRLHAPQEASGASRAASSRDHPDVPTGILTGLEDAVVRDDRVISKLIRPSIEAIENQLSLLRSTNGHDPSAASTESTRPTTDEEKEGQRELQKAIQRLEIRLAVLKDSTVDHGRKSLLPEPAGTLIKTYVSPLGSCLRNLETDLKHEFFLLTQISAFAESVWSLNRGVQKKLDGLKDAKDKNLKEILAEINKAGSNFVFDEQKDNTSASWETDKKPTLKLTESKTLFGSAVALARQVYHISERHGAPCRDLDMRDKERVENLRSNVRKLAKEFSIHRPYLPLVASALLAFVNRPEAAVLELNRYIDTLDELESLESKTPLPDEFVAQLKVYRTRTAIPQSTFMKNFNRGRVYIETELRNIDTIENVIPAEVTASFLGFAKTGDGDFCTKTHAPFHRLQLVKMFREGNFVETAISHPEFMDVYAAQALVVGERNVNVKLECVIRYALDPISPKSVQRLAAYYQGDFARIYAKLMLHYVKERQRLRMMPSQMHRSLMSKTESILDNAIQKLHRFSEEDDHKWEQAHLAQKLEGATLPDLHSNLKQARRKIRDILNRL